MYRQVVREALELLVFRHEIRLTGELDQDAHLPALMDVVADEPLADLAASLFLRQLLAALDEQLLGHSQVAARFGKGTAAVHHRGVRRFAQRLNRRRVGLVHVYHFEVFRFLATTCSTSRAVAATSQAYRAVR